MSVRKRKISEESESESRLEEENTENEQDQLDEKANKVLKIMRPHLEKELEIRERDLMKIEERLQEALRIQHFLRYAVVSSYYGIKSSQSNWPGNISGKQSLHPTVAGLLRKTRLDKDKSKGEFSESNTQDSDGQTMEKGLVEEDSDAPTKVPRYVPPVAKKGPKIISSPTRGSQLKKAHRILVGNTSRWIPIENREDGASHKWMVYARTPPGEPNLSHVVEKVRFFLHASYRPFDVIEVNNPPFRVSRRGWGEFPVRVQFHFRNPLNKPIDIIHMLVLERSTLNKEILGSEREIETWLYTYDDDQKDDQGLQNVENEENYRCLNENIKKEPLESKSDDEDVAEDISMKRDMDERSEGMCSFKAKFRPCDEDFFANVKEEPQEADEDGEYGFEEMHVQCEAVNQSKRLKMEDGVEDISILNQSSIRGRTARCENVSFSSSNEKQSVCKEESASESEEMNVDEHFGVKEEDLLVENMPGSSSDSEILINDVGNNLDVKEEVVIEDGCFQVPCEDDTIRDIVGIPSVKDNPFINTGPPSFDQQKLIHFCTSGVRNAEKCDDSSIITSAKVIKKTWSVGNNKGLGLVLSGPSKSFISIKKGLVKGTSLLNRNNVLPGTSLLLQNPSTSTSMGITAGNKSSADISTALYNMTSSSLSKRLHNTQAAATHHLLNHLPVITSKASDPAYKILHPYSADSMSTFENWPLAKKRASEWMRARIVRNFLSAQGFSEKDDDAWTTKDIMNLARLWGYSPEIASSSYCQRDESPLMSNPDSTYSIATEINKWLSSTENKKNIHQEDDEEEIEVVGMDSAPKRSMVGGCKRVGLGARAAGSQKVIILGMEPSLIELSRFVDETCRELGIVVSHPEEMIQFVYYSAAQRMLIEALKSFMNDLLRNSVLFASCSSRGKESLVIKQKDITLTLLSRKEFDIFTNENLGAEPEDSTNWDI